MLFGRIASTEVLYLRVVIWGHGWIMPISYYKECDGGEGSSRYDNV